MGGREVGRAQAAHPVAWSEKVGLVMAVPKRKVNRVRGRGRSMAIHPRLLQVAAVGRCLTYGVDGVRKTPSHANAEPARYGIVSGYADGQLRLFVFPLIDAASSDHGYRSQRRDLRQWP